MSGLPRIPEDTKALTAGSGTVRGVGTKALTAGFYPTLLVKTTGVGVGWFWWVRWVGAKALTAGFYPTLGVQRCPDKRSGDPHGIWKALKPLQRWHCLGEELNNLPFSCGALA